MTAFYPLDITFQKMWGKKEDSEAMMENAHFFFSTEIR